MDQISDTDNLDSVVASLWNGALAPISRDVVNYLQLRDIDRSFLVEIGLPTSDPLGVAEFFRNPYVVKMPNALDDSLVMIANHNEKSLFAIRSNDGSVVIVRSGEIVFVNSDICRFLIFLKVIENMTHEMKIGESAPYIDDEELSDEEFDEIMREVDQQVELAADHPGSTREAAIDDSPISVLDRLEDLAPGEMEQARRILRILDACAKIDPLAVQRGYGWWPWTIELIVEGVL